jgi:hypothetical protein
MLAIKAVMVLRSPSAATEESGCFVIRTSAVLFQGMAAPPQRSLKA